MGFTRASYLGRMTIDASKNEAPLTPPAGDRGGRAAGDVTAIGISLLEDAYMAWNSAEGECEVALESWLEQDARPNAMAFAVYRAALEREDAAARNLARLCEITRAAGGSDA